MFAEYWTQVTAIIAITWLLLSAFILWRRGATNLTPVNVAPVNKNAQPDFLKVDKKARAVALKRGEVADANIAAREANAAVTPIAPVMQRSWKWLGAAALVLSVLTLGAVAFAVFYPNSAVADYVATGGLDSVKEHPICIALSVLVLVTRLCLPFVNRRVPQATA